MSPTSTLLRNVPASGSTSTRSERGSNAVWSLIGPWGSPIGRNPLCTNEFSSARRHEGRHGTGRVSAATAAALARLYSLVAGAGMLLSPGRPETVARRAIADRVDVPIMDP